MKKIFFAILFAASLANAALTPYGAAGGGGGTWGTITGTLSDQLDLQSALDGKQSTLVAADATHNGYLLSTDWSIFNLKEPAITAGTSGQYWRGDKSFQTLDSSVVPENTNLYYTQARFDSAFSAKSTSNLSEGSNLYFTNARVDTEFDTRLATKSTTNLSEGSNLYYTDTRVQTAAKNGTPAQELYVSKDAGNDAYDGSILHPYKTIGAAVTAANVFAAYYKQAIVHVSPINNGGSVGGNYNENVSLTQQGVNLICDQSGAYSRPCVVGGTLTVNLTGVSGGTNFQAASNEVYVTGFVFASGSGNTVTFSGSIYQKLIAMNCYFQAGAARSAVVTNTGVSGSTPSEFRSYDTTFENNSSSIETVTLTAGRFWLYGTTSTVSNNNASGTSILQNGASSMIANLVQFTGQYQLTNNTATATFNLSSITSGTNPCIVTPSSPNTGYALLAYFGCNSSNTNSITGTGVVANAPGNARFGSSGDIISTVTQASIGPGLPQGELMLGPGATTGTNVMLSIKDGHIKVANTTAPTAVVNANAGTGATCTLTRASDFSGQINLTTTATAPAAGVQCTITFNKPFTTAPICTQGDVNGNAALFMVANGVFFPTTTTTLTVNYSNADLTGHANIWSYHCTE